MDLTRASWRKSTRSGSSGNCIEIADGHPGVVGVRDSKDQQGPVLSFTSGQWSDFVQSIKARQLDI
ncbi:DUF397 domain-containing protein [Micromonospora sp. SH-82]|uniref:DUF397 domain-containing protein n=1 Tax=Micromonospora sp. SH-82 TaxID=3132938 RepID=UPI003EBA5B94